MIISRFDNAFDGNCRGSRDGTVGRWVLLHVSPCDTQLSVRLSIQPGEIHPIEGHRLCVASLSLAGHCCRIVNHQINIVIGWMVG